MDCRHVVQVRPILAAVAHGDFHLSRFWLAQLISPFETGAHDMFQFGVLLHLSVERDQEGTVGRMKIANPGNGFKFEEVQQPHNSLVVFQRNLFAK